MAPPLICLQCRTPSALTARRQIGYAQLMKYIAHGSGGPPAVMQLAEGPKPTLQSGQVLVEVHYAGVNRPDVAQRLGRYPPPPDASPILGLEVAGRVVEKSADVSTLKVGDEVSTLTTSGA